MSFNLFTALFYLFLFLLMCGTLCGQVSAESLSIAGELEEIFKTGEIEVVPKLSTGPDKITVNNFYSPVFVSVGGVFVALAGADCSSPDNKSITVLTKQIDTKNKINLRNKLPTSSNEWTKLKVYNNCATESKCDGTSVVKGLVSAVKDKKMYILLVNTTTHTDSGGSDANLKWWFGLAVSDGVSSGTGKDESIEWQEQEPLELSGFDKLDKVVKEKLSVVESFGSSAFVIGKDGKITFVVKFTTVSNKNVFGFIDLDSTNKNNKLTVSYVGNAGKCYPQLFPWKNRLVMVPTRCPQTGSDDQKIKEFVDKGSGWNDSNELTFLPAYYLKDKDNFTTITVDGTEVLLITKQTIEGTNKNTFTINLWMTDGSRITNVGTIISGFTGTFYGLTLHETNQLFALFQTYKTEIGYQKIKSYIYLTRFTQQLEKIKKTLTAWKESNEKIKKLCENKSTAVIPCSTDRLVGFLSNKSTDNSSEWTDEYEYANAKVTRGKKAENGFHFDEPGAGAQWRLKSKDQPYDFANFGFTLVATVTVDEAQKDEKLSPLLGVEIGDGTKSVGVWCSKEETFAVSDGEKTNATNFSNKTCLAKKEYVVALVYNSSKTISVYVDWERVGGDYNFEINKDTQKQLTFYFGSDGTQSKFKSNLTVTNALLYNRPFNDTEIEKLKPKRNTNTNPQNSNESTTQNNSSLPNTLTTENEENKQSSSPPPTTEDSAARVAVDVLSLLFCVFTLLGRYVY